jgi:hypothetical protein
VVHEDAEPAARTGLEPVHDPGQVVDTFEVLDHDALDPQVVTPDPLDQFGVVPALDVDPAGPGHLRPDVVHRHRAGRRPRLLRRAGLLRRLQADRLAVQPEPGPERVRPDLAVPVLEIDHAVLPPDHGADEARTRLLDDHALLEFHLDGAPVLGLPPVPGQHVVPIPISHRTTVCRERPRTWERRGSRWIGAMAR